MNYTPLPEGHWLSRATIAEFGNLPWNSTKGLKATKMPDALSLLSNPNQVEWPAVGLLPLEEGQLLVKGNDEVVGLNADGSAASRFRLPEGGADLYVMTASGELIISQQGGKPKLIKFSRAGKQVWTREGDEYAMSQLLAMGEKIYLIRKGKAETNVYPIDAKTGDVGDLYETLPTIQPVFAGQKNELCFVSYSASDEARFWNQKKPDQKPGQTPIPNDLYGTFAKPIAADANSNAYAAFGSQLSMMYADGRMGYKMNFEGIAIGEDGSYYFSKYNTETKTLQLLKKEKSGAASSADITIPNWIDKAHNRASWKVVKFEGGKYHLMGRGPQTHIWNHLIYDGRIGSFVVADQPGDLTGMGDLISTPASWGIMENANIVLPVRTANSLRLLKLAI